MKKYYFFVFVIFTMLLLSGCIGQKRVLITTPTVKIPQESCIDSFDEFAFSTPDIDAPKQEIILPGSPWKMESDLPEAIQNEEVVVAVVRAVNNEQEVWIQPYYPAGVYSEEDIETYHYWIYHTSSKEWEEVPAVVEDGTVFVDQIFVRQGVIWGRNAWDSDDLDMAAWPALSRYDEEEKRFVFETETAQIPTGQTGDEFSFFANWNQIVLDPEGIFWIFVHQDAVYKYDPDTRQIEQYASLNTLEEIWQVVLANDGSFFIYNGFMGDDIYMDDNEIYQFVPKTNELIAIENPEEHWPAYYRLLADSSGRLWLGVNGWRNPDGSWMQFNPWMKEYLRVSRIGPLWRYYLPPVPIMESSDGRLWFNIPYSGEWKTLRSGIAWYDPKTNEGCWVTSEGFGLKEDDRQIIWMIAENKLYTYSLK